MQVFDASSMIYAWDNYPIRQFPGLWEWVSNQIKGKNLVIPIVAFQEVKNKIPDCATWLEMNDIHKIAISNEILQDAMRIKKLLGIVNDKYHPKGVGENDLLIIATTRSLNTDLVTEEKQLTLPKEPAKKKIPAVCAIKEVNIPCLNFIEFIKRSNEIFR